VNTLTQKIKRLDIPLLISNFIEALPDTIISILGIILSLAVVLFLAYIAGFVAGMILIIGGFILSLLLSGINYFIFVTDKNSLLDKIFTLTTIFFIFGGSLLGFTNSLRGYYLSTTIVNILASTYVLCHALGYYMLWLAQERMRGFR